MFQDTRFTFFATDCLQTQIVFGIGTVRILDIAEQRGLIKSAEESIAEMAAIGYRVSAGLLKQIRAE